MRCAASGGHASEQAGRWTKLSRHLVLLAALPGTKSWGDLERPLILLLNEYFSAYDLPGTANASARDRGEGEPAALCNAPLPLNPREAGHPGLGTWASWVNVGPQGRGCTSSTPSLSCSGSEFLRAYAMTPRLFPVGISKATPPVPGQPILLLVTHTVLLYHAKNAVHFRGNLCLLSPEKLTFLAREMSSIQEFLLTDPPEQESG